MAHVDFDEPVEPLASDTTFTLGGRVWTCRDRLDIPSHTVRRMLVATADARSDPDDIGKLRAAGDASTAFLRAAVMPSESDDLVELLNSETVDLTARRSLDVIAFLIEHALARPTTPPVRSTPGRKRTARKSTGGSSSRATPRAASAG